MPGYASQLTYEAMRSGTPAASLVQRQESLVASCDSRLVAAYGAHTTALAAKDGPGLMDVADAMQTIGALRYALEAAADAAAVFVAEGREDSARRAAARAQKLHDPAQGGIFPSIDGLDSAAVGLTAREAQLVELGLAGPFQRRDRRPSGLSVRTVESHIYRAMGKLGVSDRREL